MTILPRHRTCHMSRPLAQATRFRDPRMKKKEKQLQISFYYFFKRKFLIGQTQHLESRIQSKNKAYRNCGENEIWMRLLSSFSKQFCASLENLLFIYFNFNFLIDLYVYFADIWNRVQKISINGTLSVLSVVAVAESRGTN